MIVPYCLAAGVQIYLTSGANRHVLLPLWVVLDRDGQGRHIYLSASRRKRPSAVPASSARNHYSGLPSLMRFNKSSPCFIALVSSASASSWLFFSRAWRSSSVAGLF